MQIDMYKTKLELIINGNNNDITISDMIIEYTELQSYHELAVSSLNRIFSSITVIGLLGCYFTFMNFYDNYVGIYTYVDIVLYIIIEGIYIYAINKIKNTINDIKTIIGSPRFVMKFLKKSKLVGIKGDIYDDYENPLTNKSFDSQNKSRNPFEMKDSIYNKDTEIELPKNEKEKEKEKEKKNAGNITSRIFNKSVKESESTDLFTSRFFNSPPNDNEIELTRTKSKNQLDRKESRKGGNLLSRQIDLKLIHETIQEMQNDPNNKKKIDIIKNILYRIVILSHENGSDLDWIKLYNKLLEPWKCFNILGFDIDDDQLIQKFIFVVFTFFGLLRINDKIGI